MNGLRVLVVGNTDGIGLALTTRLLQAGCHVQGISRRASPIDHPAYDHVVCDVKDGAYPSTLHALLDGAPPDVCVYCVGIGEPLVLTRMEEEAAVFRTNLLGLVETTSLVLPAMVARGIGHFVGLSSIADEAITPEAPAYAASKAGMSSYLTSLAVALRPRGVHISNVRFGFVDTKMAKARLRPMMMTTETAVDVLMHCLRTRPARLTRPWRMAVLVRLLRWATLAKLALRRRVLM
jgi:short-subunit dehydrogenase